MCLVEDNRSDSSRRSAQENSTPPAKDADRPIGGRRLQWMALVLGILASIATIVGVVVSQSGTSRSQQNGVSSQSLPAPTIPGIHMYQPRLSLTPSSGPVGTSVTVKATGFDPNSLVTVYFQGVPVGQKTSNKNGNVMISFVVPSIAVPPSGTPFTVTAADSQGYHAVQDFTFT